MKAKSCKGCKHRAKDGAPDGHVWCDQPRCHYHNHYEPEDSVDFKSELIEFECELKNALS